MLGGGKLKSVFDWRCEGKSIRHIAAELGVSRNTVRKYLRSPEIPKPKPRPGRPSKLEPFAEYVRSRLAVGVDNCAVLLRELRELGYSGGYSILKDYVKPFRKPGIPEATVRFETEPGEQAQVDFGLCKYTTVNGKTRHIWVFVMVLSWSRAIYVEFIPRADTAAFIRCHVNAFGKLGGQPRRVLYDNTKNVVLDRDENGGPVWNQRFLDFSLTMGFEIKLCRPHRPQTKGRVESGVKYVKGNFWPSVRFTDLADLNRQAVAWAETIADVRVHGTTHERPVDRLAEERPYLQPLPVQERVAPFLREERKVGRDGFVQYEKGWYGTDWRLAGQTVQLEAKSGTVEIWSGNAFVVVHPRAVKPGQRFAAPHQWTGLTLGGDARPKPDPMAVQLPSVDVQARTLAAYEAVLGAVSGR